METLSCRTWGRWSVSADIGARQELSLSEYQAQKLPTLALGHRGAVMLQNFPPVSCRNIQVAETRGH